MARTKWVKIEKSEERQETHAQNALLAFVPAVVIIVTALVILKYFHEWFAHVGWMFIVGGAVAVVYAVWQFAKSRTVKQIDVACPYCKEVNHLIETPKSEFRCDQCQRMIPAENGMLLQVFEVRCGFCNALNYYHEKSTGLICESCNRVIPISVEDSEEAPTKAFEMFSLHDDDDVYDLSLLESGAKTEEMIDCLQHMLALNRNQVKQMFDELPVKLLSGVPRKKAELLSAQISSHGGTADVAASKR